MDTISWRRGRRRVVTQSAEQHPHSERVSEAAESANKASLAKIVILSLLAHICLVLALVRLDPLSFAASGSREIPVQVVVAEPPPPQSPAAARKETPVNERAPQETVEAQNGTNAHGAASEGEGAKERLPLRSTAVAPFDAAPHGFRSFAVPVTAADGTETINYQFVVGGMLERVKQYSENAVRRGAKGTATIGFVLDESGGAASVSLLRSSGEADLDSESVALVRRAAPSRHRLGASSVRLP
jgi:TonB family protein